MGYLSRGSPFLVLYLFGFDRRGLDFYCGVGKAHYLMCRSSGSRRAHYIGSKSGRNKKGIPITSFCGS